MEFQLQHQYFQWIFRTEFLWDGLVGSPCSPRDSQQRVFSNTTVQSINSSVLSFLYGPPLSSIHDYWKNYMDLCWQSDVSPFYMLSRLVIAFLPRSKLLLILGLQSRHPQPQSTRTQELQCSWTQNCSDKSYILSFFPPLCL